ncbi:MAG: ROK family protein [Candidatus Omnitrophica bacterium]|nr:ROK family protein [Candidatus Omnitrophota bacterium]
MLTFLGLDWGGTYIKAGLVNQRGVILKKKVYSSLDLRKPKAFIKNLESLLFDFKSPTMRAIGIGAPGMINVRKGFIYYLPNIPGWENYPLKEVLEKRLKLPVVVDNDANVFGLAEARCGAAKGLTQAIFLTLGTGLGGAVLVENKLLRGRTSAAELGHVPISLNGQACGCGSRGCIETYVGNNYLLKRYRQLKKNSKVSEVKEIFQRGLRGEREALLVWKEFSMTLGKFLSGMINVFNPQAIVFGGGVSGAFRLFKPLVLEVIRKEAMWPQTRELKLLRARLKNPGIIGAAILAKEYLEGK